MGQTLALIVLIIMITSVAVLFMLGIEAIHCWFEIYVRKAQERKYRNRLYFLEGALYIDIFIMLISVLLYAL